MDQALIYADKLIELHSAGAREMQASLSDYPSTKDAYGYAALNALIRDFGYAQFQGVGNPEGWFKAAEIAGREMTVMNAGNPNGA